MLTRPEVVPYVLHRKLIAVDSVVQGDLAVVDRSRRNQSFGVVRERHPSYLLKQSVDPQWNTSIANEALLYEFFHSDPGRNGLARYLPHFWGFDSERHILVLEFLTGAEDLHSYHARYGRFSADLAAQMGDALGLLHLKNKDGLVEERLLLARRFPWVFSVHRPNIRTLRDISSANLQLIRIIQHHQELSNLLDQLAEEWKTDDLIHFDVKWDNCLVYRTGSQKARLKLIDWEFAGAGDADWDVASFFSAYLAFWILSIPASEETPPEQSFHLARHPIERMQPAMRAFWNSYIRRREYDAIQARVSLLRAVRYAAAKLVETSFQQLRTESELAANVVCNLQLCLNILKRPEDALLPLLGIQPELA